MMNEPAPIDAMVASSISNGAGRPGIWALVTMICISDRMGLSASRSAACSSGDWSAAYWQSWARSYDLVIDRLGHGPASTGETISALSNFAAFGDKQLDTLGTVAPYMMTGTSVRRVESQAVGWCAPEVLRVEAEDLLRDDPMDRHDAAEALLEQSIAIAEEQGAVAWELRSSTSLALLRNRQGRQHEAFDLVKPVYSRYTEGFETADLLRAGGLIDALQNY